MPVDKLSHTDNGSTWTVQRTVSGGVTLSQVTDASLLTDGPNTVTADINLDSHNLVHMNNPENNRDAAHNYCIDNTEATSVFPSGDTITGDLLLSIGSNHLCMLACNYMKHDHAPFNIYLCNEENQIQSTLSQPIL